MPSPKRDAVAIRSGGSWIVRAWKWGAGSLSAGAALVSIISSVRSLPADHVRWIGVRPTADTAWALGDSIQLALTLTDAHGGIVPGVQVGWTSTDTAVATVDSAGTVVARAPGQATVVGADGGKSVQSRLLVRSSAADIWLPGNSAPPDSWRGWWTPAGIPCRRSRSPGGRPIRPWPRSTAPAGSRA